MLHCWVFVEFWGERDVHTQRVIVWRTSCCPSKDLDVSEYLLLGWSGQKGSCSSVQVAFGVGLVGGNAEDYGEVWFLKEGFLVVYRVDAHVGVGE